MARFSPEFEKLRKERSAKISKSNENVAFLKRLQRDTYYLDSQSTSKNRTKILARKINLKNWAEVQRDKQLRKEYRRGLFKSYGLVAVLGLFVMLAVFVGEFSLYDTIDNGYVGKNIYSSSRLYKVEKDEKGNDVVVSTFNWSFDRLVEKLTNFDSVLDGNNFFADTYEWSTQLMKVDTSDNESDNENDNENLEEVVPDGAWDWIKWGVKSLLKGNRISQFFGSIKRLANADGAIGVFFSAVTQLIGFIVAVVMRLVASLVDALNIFRLLIFGGFA